MRCNRANAEGSGMMDDHAKTFLEEMGTVIGEAVQEIAETMLFVEIDPATLRLDGCGVAQDYCAVIDFSEGIDGCFCLVAPERAALKLASGLLGEERLEMDPEMLDSFGEVANMVAGGLVSRVEGRYGSVRMTPPELVQGGAHPFAAEGGVFTVHHGFELDGVGFCAEFFIAGQCLLNRIRA